MTLYSLPVPTRDRPMPETPLSGPFSRSLTSPEADPQADILERVRQATLGECDILGQLGFGAKLRPSDRGPILLASMLVPIRRGGLQPSVMWTVGLDLEF